VSPAGPTGHETGPATQAEAGNPSPRARNAAPSADWRDDIISAARRQWQPGPNWPDNPALHRSPDKCQSDLGFEADY
jgi:hypothetical protein